MTRDEVIRCYGMDPDTPRIDGVAGRTIQDMYLDPYEMLVIVFTDGATLVVREASQTGEMEANPVKEAKA